MKKGGKRGMKRCVRAILHSLPAFGLAAVLFFTALPADAAFGNTEQLILSDREAQTERALWDSCASGYWRSRLSAPEQAFFDDVYGMLMELLCGTQDLTTRVGGSGTIALTPYVYTYDLSREQIQRIGELFLYNEPQFFFVNNGYSLAYMTESSGAVRRGISFSCFADFQNGVKRRQTATGLRQIVLSYRNDAASLSAKVDRTRRIHDRLGAEMSYVSTAYDQSVYAALFEHQGVCAAYSEAFAMLANAAGVETISVTSSSHEWNEVRLDDGDWYAVDLTWDDQTWGVADTYFCVSDAFLLSEDIGWSGGSHVPETVWNGLNRPVCLYSYSERYAHIHTWNEGVVTVAATAVSEGQILYTCTGCGETITGTLPRLGGAVGMHRLYYPGTHEHFYTADENEYRHLVTVGGWNDEGIGWYAPSDGVPVYRLFNPYTTDHHYTMDLNEYTVLGNQGWNQEGIGWYSDPNQTVYVYRQFSPYLVTGTHNYTTDLNEKNVNAAGGAWIDEGIGWYGVNP